ncbi:MAG: VWA domain-containing protein [Deltaproteobacteria bacterium]|nr:VWA domain-containing protein [Deltaproteobacteria bacterium]
MKIATVPYLLLGAFATLGAAIQLPNLASTSTPELVTSPPAVVTTSPDGNVTLKAELERTHLPAGLPQEVFARIQIEGIDDPEKAKERLPIDLTLVIDTSGSMSGQKMKDAISASKKAVRKLAPGDHLRVIQFSSSAKLIYDHQVFPGNIETVAFLDGLHAGGGTNMREAFNLAESSVSSSKYDVRRVLVVGDGHPDTQRGLKEVTARLAQRGVVTSTVGIGEGYNEDLMAEIADKGTGNYQFAEKGPALEEFFRKELQDMKAVVARNAKLVLRGPIKEVIGYTSTTIHGGQMVLLGDIVAGRPLHLLVKLQANAGDVNSLQKLLQPTLRYEATQDSASGALRPTRELKHAPLIATFVASEKESVATENASVVVQAEKLRTAQALIAANEYYNRGELKKAEAHLIRQQKVLQKQSARYGSRALANEATEMNQILDDNRRGTSSRRTFNNMMKNKSWKMSRGQ